MRSALVVFMALALAACSPAPPSGDYAPGAAEAPANADWGPYANSWDGTDFSRFRHTLNAPAPGPRAVTLWAQTNSPGGETVAVYPVGPDGVAQTERIVFVIASLGGESQTASLDFPADGGSVPVEVVVENASGNRYAGSYTLTLAP